MNSEELHLQKLQELVQKAIKEEQLLSNKLIEVELEESLSFGELISDKIASFGGSWMFIIFFLTCMCIWMFYNTFVMKEAFDPYPYILLNLILSCIAAIQAPIIMMSQNRQEAKDRRRSRNDYLVNLKAELEIRGLHSKFDLLMAEQMKALFEFQKIQTEALRKIEKVLNIKE